MKTTQQLADSLNDAAESREIWAQERDHLIKEASDADPHALRSVGGAVQVRFLLRTLFSDSSSTGLTSVGLWPIIKT